MTQRSDQGGPDAARRERKRTRMKVMLQTEALRLFAEKGYEQTTVEDIADAAAISARTFFRYFPTKEDVVVWDEGEAAAVRLWQSRAANEPLGASLWPLMRENLETLSRSDPERLLARIRLSFAVPQVRARFVDQQRTVVAALLGAAHVRARSREELKLRALYSAAVSAAGIAFDLWQQAGGKGGLGQYFDRAMEALVEGVQELRRDG